MTGSLASEMADAEAARIAALKAGACAARPQDWASALEHLRRAARLGSRLALAELAALAFDWDAAQRILAGEAVPSSSADRLSASIDLAKWLEPPQSTIISERPRIVAVAEMAGAELCEWVIARARGRLAPAATSDRLSGENYVLSNVRTNSVCDFRGADADLVLATLRARIAALTGTRLETFESVHVLRYGVGEEFRPHLDATLDSSAPDYSARYAAGEQRVLTFLLALNDDFEGGDTEFPAIGLRWKPRRGRGLFFWSVHPDGAIDQRTLHAGRPVTRGEKWMLSQWIDGRRPALS
jgi:prolyl 4-hydroxylase